MKRREKRRKTDRTKHSGRIPPSNRASHIEVPADQPAARVDVPANHQRSISARLSLLDRCMCDVERWASLGELSSVLYQEHNTLTPEQGREILAQVSAVRAILAQLRQDLELQPKVGLVVRSIQAGCTTSCLSLAELDPKRLRRFGEVPPSLAGYLEPRLAELAERLRQIAGVASESGRVGQNDAPSRP
jgi:hypothetical protein